MRAKSISDPKLKLIGLNTLRKIYQKQKRYKDLTELIDDLTQNETDVEVR